MPLLLITKYQKILDENTSQKMKIDDITKNENWWLFDNQITAKRVQLAKFKVLFAIFDADSNPKMIKICPYYTFQILVDMPRWIGK